MNTPLIYVFHDTTDDGEIITETSISLTGDEHNAIGFTRCQLRDLIHRLQAAELKMAELQYPVCIRYEY